MTWEHISLGLFVAASSGVLLPVVALMKHRDYSRRITKMPAATEFEDLQPRLALAQQKVKDLHEQEVRRDRAIAEADEAAARKVQIEEDLRQIEPKRLELETIERQLATEKENVADVLQRKAEAEAKIKQYLNLRYRLKAELQELTEKVDGAKALADQLPGLQAELQTLQSRLDSKNEEIERTLATLADRQHELTQVEGRRDSLHTEVRGLEQCRGHLEAEITELTEKVNRAKVIAEHLPALQAELQTLQSRLETKNQEIERAAARLADTQRELAQIEGRRDSLHTEVRGLEQRRGELEGIIDNLNARVRKAGELEDDAEQQALADLTRLPPCLKEAGLTQGRGPVTEERALADLQQYLEQLGLRFPRRTLYAFHTCLKINDLSPLTVLAGISGTGKSELPRRYAQGMGMHFLQMAVQPRWDSPQDLFGFYNYLEHRYIATDLARALVHLDYHNRTELAGPWQDRMLLVLLDEMNLARVEYYFSEFLSRLEVRKSVVANDPTKRLDAEIQLDIGGREKPFNLFVDRNVLFVGTMNEDESTQTLSDKVIDRANVLRFGRPLKLADQQPDDAGPRNGRFLSRETWAGWWRTIDTLDSHDRERLPQWIKRLNDAMEALERPFAHRINQAILLYCANYPGEGRERVDHAFADQLEQRILPKLRGLDTEGFSDPLGQLQTLIEETGDKALATAMETAMEKARNRRLFSFQGVNRQD